MEKKNRFSESPVYADTENMRVFGATEADFWDGVFGTELMAVNDIVMYHLEDTENNKYLVRSDFSHYFLAIEQKRPSMEPDAKELKSALIAALHHISKFVA